MEIGCSPCVANAIVSHQLKRLRELLEQPVHYLDLFWMPIGSAHGLLPVASVETNTQLVEFSGTIDVVGDAMDVDEVGCVGRADCRHEAFDVELREPIPTVAISDRVLVSLPVLARWHSSDRFPAVQLLCDSGKFDLSEPQLYHKPDRYSYWLEEPLNRTGYTPGSILHFELDLSTVRPSLEREGPSSLQHSNRPTNLTGCNFVRGSAVYGEGYLELTKFTSDDSVAVDAIFNTRALKWIYQDDFTRMYAYKIHNFFPFVELPYFIIIILLTQ